MAARTDVKDIGTKKGRTVILPDGGRELLRQELALALNELGYEALRVHPDALRDEHNTRYLPRLLDSHPALFFSVNMQGLLPGGASARLLAESGIPVLIWFVDNPWNILSGMRDPVWKRFNLAVTDHTFISPLQKAGAKSVLHLPLAASPQHMSACGNNRFEGLKNFVFVGRSTFPGMETFFAGQSVPDFLERKAGNMLIHGFLSDEERPDFNWWVKELSLYEQQEQFWPGKKSRRPGLGATLSNIAWRSACLKALKTTPQGLSIFGDSAWEGLLKTTSGHTPDLRAPLDYYTVLPDLYRAAPFSLNLNSLILPGGLTQRIFDIWTAGGFCLTDWSRGLDIFPEELVNAVCFCSAAHIQELARSFAENPKKREELRLAWREHINEKHNYTVRLQDILAYLNF